MRWGLLSMTPSSPFASKRRWRSHTWSLFTNQVRHTRERCNLVMINALCSTGGGLTSGWRSHSTCVLLVMLKNDILIP